ncbi:MAG: hypothetical protein KBS62_02955 [Oscillospiraceae bacterium]|nr:hypothetical protein [Candidatus Ruminococcus equi]
MEEKLKRLFDFQKFEKNEKLSALIEETQKRYAEELSEEDLEQICAAGDIASLLPGTSDTINP